MQGETTALHVELLTTEQPTSMWGLQKAGEKGWGWAACVQLQQKPQKAGVEGARSDEARGTAPAGDGVQELVLPGQLRDESDELLVAVAIVGRRGSRWLHPVPHCTSIGGSCVHSESAPPSPVENLRWLEDRLDVTYSAVCCSYNAGTTTLLLRLPNAVCAEGGECSGRSVADSGSSSSSLDMLSWQQREGAAEQNLVDIFGRFQDLEGLQAKHQSKCLNAGDTGLLELAPPAQQQGGHSAGILPSEALGPLAQIEETVDSCAEDECSIPQRSDPALSPTEFKQSEEAYSLRNLLNNCLMFPATRKLSVSRKKGSGADADVRLKESGDTAYNRGLQFLQWRGRLPKTASAGRSSLGGDGGVRAAEGFAENEKMIGGGFASPQHEARLAREKLRQASRFLSLRKSKNGATENGALSNVVSALSVSSLG
ncbi:hypothetical protein Emag_006191 [Eimeria magna]